jgi:hypothetical protein
MSAVGEWFDESNDIARDAESVRWEDWTLGRGQLRLENAGHVATVMSNANVDNAIDGWLLAMYKPKSRKVEPVEETVTAVPEVYSDWTALVWRRLYNDAPMSIRQCWKSDDEPLIRSRTCTNWDAVFLPRFTSHVPQGSRLTPERWSQFPHGCVLNTAEREAFLAMLLRREAALAWDWQECGLVRREVCAPARIRTVPHKPWRVARGYDKKRYNQLVDAINERIKRGALEPSQGAYQNPWFTIVKKDGRLRIINNAQHINAVTIRDSNAPALAEEFAETMAGRQIVTLIDWFSGYDQIELDERDRDLTAFMTPMGLLRQTRVVQGATNSVAQFSRVNNWIIRDLVQAGVRTYLDDVAILVHAQTTVKHVCTAYQVSDDLCWSTCNFSTGHWRRTSSPA